MTASVVLKGCDYLGICSLLQYSVDSVMVCGRCKAVVVDVETMDLVKAININTGDIDIRFTRQQL